MCLIWFYFCFTITRKRWFLWSRQSEQNKDWVSMSGSQSPQTQEGPTETQEGPRRTQDGLAETQQDPTVAQESFKESQEGPAETQEGPSETQGGPAESQEGLIETLAEETDPSGLSPNTNHRGDHQRLEGSRISLQPPDKPSLTEQQESLQAEQAEAEKPPAGPYHTGQDQLPTEENLESFPTIQADLGGSIVPKRDQEDPRRHEQTLNDIGHSGRSVEPPSGCSTGEPKLCGFLMKQGSPLKTWKLRWFTYEDQQNQLFYSRTPQDVTPLGRIELCSATFTYPLEAETGTFHVRTPERTFVLKVRGPSRG